MHQLYADSLADPGATVLLQGPERHYLGKALRARPGERFRLADPSGQAVVAELLSVDSAAAVLRVESLDPDPVDAFEVALELCAPRGEALDQAVDMAVQLGAAELTLLRSERTLVDLEGDGFRRERLEKRVREAARQCLRARLPRLNLPQRLEDVLAREDGARRLFFSERGGQPLAQAMAGAVQGERMRILIGPEGGFSAGELELAARLGWPPVSLGPRPLRVPTAVAAALGGLRALQTYA